VREAYKVGVVTGWQQASRFYYLGGGICIKVGTCSYYESPLNKNGHALS
jgi:hypothetical protein